MSVKKKSSKRRSTKVKVVAAGNSQMAAARRSAEAQVKALIAKFSPSHFRLISAIRKSLRRRLPNAQEIVYEYRDFFVISFSPNEHGYEGVLGIRASADGAKLFFNNGTKLSDPEKLLRGSGKQVRSLDVENVSTLTRPAIANMIDEAIARNTVPFEKSGRGSVIIQSSPTKPRPRRKTKKSTKRAKK